VAVEIKIGADRQSEAQKNINAKSKKVGRAVLSWPSPSKVFYQWYQTLTHINPMNTENNGLNNGRDEQGRFMPGNSVKPVGSTKNRLRDSNQKFPE
jgi:hypothetical protein